MNSDKNQRCSFEIKQEKMKKNNRRSFIKSAVGISAGIVSAPFILKSYKPSNQTTIGMIGTGVHCMTHNLPPS
ncbi:MAG: hypothetical protein MI975_12880 [Cytophagales bacterium]|nr:hypothetical protein [Cytophagales bacterium]